MQTSQNNGISFSRALVVEAIIFLTYAVFSLSWAAGTALNHGIMDTFGLKEISPWVNNAITIAKIIGNFVAAGFLIKMGAKRGFFIAGLLVACVGIGAFAFNFPMFIVTRFIMGFGGAFVLVALTPIVMECFPLEKRPLYIGLNGVANNFGTLIGFAVIAPVLAMVGSWQNTILFFAGLSAILAVAWLIFGVDFQVSNPINVNKEVAPEEKFGYLEGFKDKFAYFWAFGYCGWLTLYVVIIYLFPLSKSVKVDHKLMIELMLIGGIVATPFGIMATKFFTKKLPIIRFSGLAGSVLAFLMLQTSSPFIALTCAFLLGFLVFLPMPTYASLPQWLPNASKAKVTVLTSLFWCFSYIVETIAFTGITHVVNTKGFQLGMTIAVVFSLTLFISSFLLPELGKEENTAK